MRTACASKQASTQVLNEVAWRSGGRLLVDLEPLDVEVRVRERGRVVVDVCWCIRSVSVHVSLGLGRGLGAIRCTSRAVPRCMCIRSGMGRSKKRSGRLTDAVPRTARRAEDGALPRPVSACVCVVYMAHSRANSIDQRLGQK